MSDELELEPLELEPILPTERVTLDDVGFTTEHTSTHVTLDGTVNITLTFYNERQAHLKPHPCHSECSCWVAELTRRIEHPLSPQDVSAIIGLGNILGSLDKACEAVVRAVEATKTITQVDWSGILTVNDRKPERPRPHWSQGLERQRRGNRRGREENGHHGHRQQGHQD